MFNAIGTNIALTTDMVGGLVLQPNHRTGSAARKYIVDIPGSFHLLARPPNACAAAEIICRSKWVNASNIGHHGYDEHLVETTAGGASGIQSCG